MVQLKINPPIDYDVVIVGAGPAGASAATHIARSGLKAVIIEQYKFPRDKVCGDFVSPVALLELQELGVVKSAEYQRTNIIRSASIFLDGRQMINNPIPEVSGMPSYGRVIPRKKLDSWIVSIAQESGVKLIENYRVKEYLTENNNIKVIGQQRGHTQSWNARLIIGADGSSSLTARQMLGRLPSTKNRIIASRAYYEGVACTPDQAELYFSTEIFPGYYWIFPTGEGIANVGVGMLLETLPNATTHLTDLLKLLIEKDPAFSKRMKQARQIGKVSSWPLSTYDPHSLLHDDRVLLAGDAAGLINPLNGEGIQNALLSGRWAAEIAMEAVQQDDYSQKTLQAYTKRVHNELDYDMALASLIVDLIRNRSLNPIWMQLLRIIINRARANPAYADITGGVLAGMVPAHQVIQPSIIGETIKQAAFSIGIGTAKHILHGPKDVMQFGLAMTLSGVDIAGQVGQHPLEYMKWGREVTLSAINVVGQMVDKLISGSIKTNKVDTPLPYQLKIT